MPKKVVIVSSSPRKDGNSDILAQEFARGARDAGHCAEIINVRDMQLKFCTGCMSCMKRDGCILDDGMNAVYGTIRDADALVLASPVYYYAVSGQLKTFLDRLNPLYGRKNNFKDVYLLSASAEDDEAAMDGSVKDIRGWTDCFDGVKLAGVLRGTGLEARGDVKDTDFPEKAYNMGKNV